MEWKGFRECSLSWQDISNWDESAETLQTDGSRFSSSNPIELKIAIWFSSQLKLQSDVRARTLSWSTSRGGVFITNIYKFVFVHICTNLSKIFVQVYLVYVQACTNLYKKVPPRAVLQPNFQLESARKACRDFIKTNPTTTSKHPLGVDSARTNVLLAA